MAQSTKPGVGAVSVALLALGYAVSLVALRAATLGGSAAVAPDAELLTWSLLRLPCHLAEGFMLAFVILPRRIPLVVGVASVSLAVVLNGISVHCEALMGTLPTLYSATYLGELGQAEASVTHIAAILIAETFVLTAGLAAAAIRLRRARPRGDPRVAIAVGLAAATVALAFHHWPMAIDQQGAWPSRIPSLWFFGGAMDFGDEEDLTAADAAWFHEQLGRDPGGRAEGTAICAPPPEPTESATSESVLLVVLESVGTDDVTRRRDGAALMPNLAAAQRRGVAADVWSAGTRSAQAAPALYAGLAAQTDDILLWREELPRLDGLPSQLRELGYRTAYFHGGDLDFEQQREFLRATGFSEVHERRSTEASAGWGTPDEIMLARLLTWLDGAAEAEEPWFAAWATLSTHHPYTLPADHTGRHAGEGLDHDFDESLSYLDDQVGQLLSWHDTAEDTWLILVADHASLNQAAAASIRGAVPALRTPLIVLGPRQRQLDPPAGPAVQYDVPPTIAGLLGVPRARCGYGVDLFADHAAVRARLVYSVSGRELDELLVIGREGSLRVWHRQDRTRWWVEPERDAGAQLQRYRRFANIASAVSRRHLELGELRID